MFSEFQIVGIGFVFTAPLAQLGSTPHLPPFFGPSEPEPKRAVSREAPLWPRFTEMGHSFEMTMPRGSNAFNTSLEIVKDRKFLSPKIFFAENDWLATTGFCFFGDVSKKMINTSRMMDLFLDSAWLVSVLIVKNRSIALPGCWIRIS